MADWAEREATRIDKARYLLEPGIRNAKGVWADFGCGEGIFTAALLTLLHPIAKLIAIDRNRLALRQLKKNFAKSFPDASIETIQADFSQPISLPPLAGLVMANALHFETSQQDILNLLVSYLLPGGKFILVEYNTDAGNRWVPYPLSDKTFVKFASAAGLSKVSILRRIPSTFLGEMYAGVGINHPPVRE